MRGYHSHTSNVGGVLDTTVEGGILDGFCGFRTYLVCNMNLNRKP